MRNQPTGIDQRQPASEPYRDHDDTQNLEDLIRAALPPHQDQLIHNNDATVDPLSDIIASDPDPDHKPVFTKSNLQSPNQYSANSDQPKTQPTSQQFDFRTKKAANKTSAPDDTSQTPNDTHIAKKPSPSASTPIKRYVFPSLIGFIIGVVFWHFVGFWNFVSEAVFHGPRDKLVVEKNDRQPQQKTSAIETGSIEKTQPARSKSVSEYSADCSTMTYDASSRRMRVTPCPQDAKAKSNSDRSFKFGEKRLNQNPNLSEEHNSNWLSNTKVTTPVAEPAAGW